MSDFDNCRICGGPLVWDNTLCTCMDCGRVYSIEELRDEPNADQDREEEIHYARYGN